MVNTSTKLIAVKQLSPNQNIKGPIPYIEVPRIITYNRSFQYPKGAKTGTKNIIKRPFRPVTIPYLAFYPIVLIMYLGTTSIKSLMSIFAPRRKISKLSE